MAFRGKVGFPFHPLPLAMMQSKSRDEVTGILHYLILFEYCSSRTLSPLGFVHTMRLCAAFDCDLFLLIMAEIGVVDVVVVAQCEHFH